MSTSAFDFGAFVPGFDFLQKLAGMGKQPASALPAMGQWVAPTLSVEDIDKRIQELKAVQFWLDQNATALKATVQALEVQKMTLATLNGMNVSLHDMAQAFQIKPTDAAPAATPAPTPTPASAAPTKNPFADSFKPAARAPEPEPAPVAEPEPPAPVKVAEPEPAPAVNAAAASGIDPMQWWGALTTQFQQIANQAMGEVAKHAAAPLGAVGKAAKSPTAAKKATPAKKAAAKASSKTAAKASKAKAASGRSATAKRR